MTPKEFEVGETTYEVHNPTIHPDVLVVTKSDVYKEPELNKLLLKMMQVLGTDRWTLISCSKSVFKENSRAHLHKMLKVWMPKNILLMGEEFSYWFFKKNLKTTRGRKLHVQQNIHNIYTTDCPKNLYNNPIDKKKSYQDLCILKASL